MLARLNNAPVDSPQVQQTRLKILTAIEAELEANARKQFITLGIVDQTPVRIIRRLSICFWMPMIREWMGSSLMAYYSSVNLSQVGAKPSLVSILAGVLIIFFALGCVSLYYTVEKVERRSILMYGAMALSVLILIFMILQVIPQHAETSIQWAGIGIIFIFLFVFGWARVASGCIALKLHLWSTVTSAVPSQYSASGSRPSSRSFAGPIGLTNIWREILPVGIEWQCCGNLLHLLPVSGNKRKDTGAG